MSIDSHRFDKSTLIDLLRLRYSLWDTSSLEFIPKVGVGDIYVAHSNRGRYFVKVHDPDPEDRSALEFSLRLAAHLLDNNLLTHIIKPLETTDGELMVFLDQYPISLYRFVEGTTAERRQLTDTDCQRLGTAIAQLHNSVRVVDWPDAPRVGFQPWAAQVLLAFLNSTDCDADLDRRVPREIREALLTSREELLKALDTFTRLHPLPSPSEESWAVTHGDLSLENILYDHSDNFYIIDWTEAYIAPVERDLVSLARMDSKSFLAAYLTLRGGPHLDIDLCAFYIYANCLNPMAFCVNRIVHDLRHGRHNADDFLALGQFLPFSDARLQSTVESVARALEEL